MVLYVCNQGEHNPETKGETTMKVYAVQTIDTDDCVMTVKTEVFSTREKAKEYFGEQVQLYKDMLDTDNYGEIEDETDESFSWTAESGFSDNALEIDIKELEVK